MEWSTYGTIGNKLFFLDFDLLQISRKNIPAHSHGISAENCRILVGNRSNALRVLRNCRKSFITFMNFKDAPAKPSPIRSKVQVKEDLTSALQRLSISAEEDDNASTQTDHSLKVVSLF